MSTKSNKKEQLFFTTTCNTCCALLRTNTINKKYVHRNPNICMYALISNIAKLYTVPAYICDI